MKTNVDLLTLAGLLVLTTVLTAVLALRGVTVPAELASADSVLLGAVAAIATGSRASTKTTLPVGSDS